MVVGGGCLAVVFVEDCVGIDPGRRVCAGFVSPLLDTRVLVSVYPISNRTCPSSDQYFSAGGVLVVKCEPRLDHRARKMQ